MLLTQLKKSKPYLLPLLIAAALTACSDGVKNSNSDLSTVHIEQSSVKNQYKVGFCWSYALVGFLESLELKKDHKMDLSEEYLGYYNMLDRLKKAIYSENPMKELDKVSEGFLILDAFQLADKVGLVPEEVFSLKFETDDQAGLEKKLRQYFKAAIADEEALQSYRDNPKKIEADFAAIFGKKAPKPEDTFEYDGVEYNALSFMQKKLKAKSSDYKRILVTKDNWQANTHYIKAAMMSHIPVPLGFVVFADPIKKKYVFDLNECPPEGCKAVGGHAVIAVDFITEGGRGGEMPIDEAKEVFHNPLDSLIIKNSWGFKGVSQEGDDVEESGDKGYNLFDSTLLRGSLDEWGFYFAMVPKKVDTPEIKFVEAGLKAAITFEELVKTIVLKVDKEATFKADLLDVPDKDQAEDVSYFWEIKQDGKSVVEASNVDNVKFTGETVGEYEITLTTTLGDESHEVTKSFVVK